MKKFLRSLVLIFILLVSATGFLACDCGAPAIETIVLGEDPEYFEVGDEYTYTVTLTPSKASKSDIVWTSSNPNVATVNSNGKVVGRSAGLTTITAMSKKNSSIKDYTELLVRGTSELVILLDKTFTYDGTQKSLVAASAPAGLELRYTYEGVSINYPESEVAPINVGEYKVRAKERISGTVMAQATLHINKKTAYITIGDYSKRYSTEDPEFNATITGLIGEDTISYTLSRASGESVGTYKIDANYSPAPNYDVRVSPGRLVINQLDVKIEVDGKTSIYGDSLVPLTYTIKTTDNYILDNVMVTSQVSGNLVLEYDGDHSRIPYGSYAISPVNLTSTNLNIVSKTPGTYNISKRTAIISIAANQFKYAGENDSALRYGIEGTLEGDSLDGCLTRLEGEVVGFYDYIIDQSLDLNYNIITDPAAVSYKYEIRSNVVNIDFNDFEINYSAANAEDFIPEDKYQYTITLNEEPIDYTINAEGKVFLNQTDAIVLSHEVTKELHLSDEEKEIYYQKWKVVLDKVDTSGYIDPAKYTFTFGEGYKYLKLITLTVMADSATRIYGDPDPEFTYTLSGLLDGDNVDNVIEKLELKRANGENVGSYEISLKSDIELKDGKSYYKLTFVPSSLVVIARELFITPISYTVDNPVYYGEGDKPLEINTENTNIATRDTLNSIISGELSRPAINEVGVYDILDNKLRLTSTNYYMTYTKGVYTIVPRPIIVTAINRTIQYGETVAKYNYSVEIVDEFVYNAGTDDEYTEIKPFGADYAQPNVTGKLSLTTFGTLYAGNSYTIGRGTITAGRNFDITFNTGTLTVVPREVTIAFEARSYEFEKYQQDNPEPKYNFTPKLAYSDSAVLAYYGTKKDNISNIISLNKNEGEETYALQINFVNSEGTIINDCYNLTIDENYIELFYLGESTFDIAITGLDGNKTVSKNFGQRYDILDTFKISWTNTDYDVVYDETAFNIKGITNADTKVTPGSTSFNAGSYTVAVFNDKISIIDREGNNVSRNFALNITTYGSLIVNKVNLTINTAPTVDTIVYGTERPNFNGGTYSFTDEDGNVINIAGTDAEYSTANTSSYPVQEAMHSIMVTFTPNNQNFNSLVHPGVELKVVKKWVSTTELTWKYGASVENLGTVDGDNYTTWSNIEDVVNLTYNGAYTEENEYVVPGGLANATFLNKNLLRQHYYYGIRFHDVGDETGFMYYVDGTEVKKVFPADKTSFYTIWNKSTDSLEFHYHDGTTDYLLTDTSTLGDGNTPVIYKSAYSPTISGIYFATATISSSNPNYAVTKTDMAGFETTDDPVIYHNTFLVNKIIVAVYNFTTEITYNEPIEFYYITDPEEVTGVVTKYWKKTAEPDIYTQMPAGETPVNVGQYAVTFLIDKQNHYYYKDFYYFEIKPIQIVVEWGEYSEFDFISTTQSITRPFIVKAAGEVVYDSNDKDTKPDWLEIAYSGRTNMNWTFPTNIPPEYQGIIPADIPSFAGEYTIIVSTRAAMDGSRNYTGEEVATYKINPRLYGGNINAKQGARLTYDVAYNGNSPGNYTGAKKYYNDLKAAIIDYGGEDPSAYNLVLSYNGTEIRSDGLNYEIIETNLNQAGGPYRIALTISSVDGNIRETVKVGLLNVFKADIPTMANYATRQIDIPYSGVQEFNPLKSSDLSVAYTPTEAIKNNVTNFYTYLYQHQGNKDIYFGIEYTYYLVLSSNETTGVQTEAPRTPDDGGENIFMVKAVIVNGANYNKPDKDTYIGYFKVVRTKVTMLAENVTETYTGERFTLPEVIVRNTDLIPVAIKYNAAEENGVYVERTIKRGTTTTSRIDVVGTYTITFKLDNSEGFFLSGSTFETTCTFTVLPKKIDGLENFVTKPDPFVATEIKGKFLIDKAKAKAHDKNYTDNTGYTVYIQLFITDSADGTGATWGPVETNSKFLDELPAGTYYYYVAVRAGSTSNIKNYTNSDYVQFEITRKPITIEIDDAHKDGIVINYAAGAAIAYDTSYIIAKKDGSSLNTLVLSDYHIEYKLHTEPDSAYKTEIPSANGVYDVKIKCYNDFYESNEIITQMTIDAPIFTIDGAISFTYGQLNSTLDISLSATATNYSDSLSETKTDTISTAAGDMDFYSYTPETSKGRWFILKNDFGVSVIDTNIPDNYTLTKEGADFRANFGAEVNTLLAARSATLQTRNSLGQFEAGNHTIWVIYVSYDSGFAVSCAEIPVAIAKYNVTNSMISINNDVKYSVVDSKGTFNTTVKYGAESDYDVSEPTNPIWTYKNISVAETIAFAPTITYISLNDSKQPVTNTVTIDCSATLNGTFNNTNIKDYFADSSKKTPLAATNLSLNNVNYLFDTDIRFILYAEYEKQIATVFSNKLAPNGTLEELEVSYGKGFLDEYWLNLFNKSELDYDMPDKLANSEGHIYLYNLINMPMAIDGETINNMRKAWPAQSGRWYQYYTMTVYRYLGLNADGSVKYDNIPVSSSTVYNESNNIRSNHSYTFYKYDIDPGTDAGQYYIVIKISASDYFLETTLEALIRVKPSTYIAMTSTDAAEGLITSTTETVKAYIRQDDGTYRAATQNYKIGYYYTPAGEAERLAYESYYNHSAGTYTSTSNPNAQYSSFANMVNNNGATLFTRQYTIRITPDNTNSMYVEDSSAIVIGSFIDIGQFNIYDQLLLGEKGEADGLVNTNPDLSVLADIGTLAWAGILSPIFEKTGDSLTEEALSILYYMDRNLSASGTTGAYYFDFNITPDGNNQIAFTNVPLYLELEDGSSLSIILKFTVNMKLVSHIDNNAFIYDGSAKIPNVKVYFQGWNAHIVGESQIGTTIILPDIDTIAIKEIAPATYYYQGAPNNPVFFDAESGNPVDSPENAGSYRMETTYTISFGGTEVEFKCINSYNINKVMSTVSITSQDFIYDSHSKALTADAGGLPVTITYYNTKTGNVETSPKNAGVYRAVAEVSDANHFGTAVGILTIRPTYATVVITPPASLTYTGSTITPTYKIYNENNDDITSGISAKITYNGGNNNPVRAGSYIYKIEIGENDNCLPLTVQYEYSIERARPNVTFTEPASYVYSGSEIAPIPVIPNDVATYAKVTYNGSETKPKDAGVYEVYVNITPPATSDYLAATYSMTYIILPKAFGIYYDGKNPSETITLNYSTTLSASSLNYSCDGEASVEFEYEGYPYNSDGSLSTTPYKSSTFPNKAGVYTITAKPGSTNYEGKFITSLIINRVTPTIGFILPANLNYNDTRKTVTVDTDPDVSCDILYTGASYDGVLYNSAEAPINAGTYLITATFAGDENYTYSQSSRSFDILKQEGAVIEFKAESLEKIYTTTVLSPEAVVKVAGVEVPTLSAKIKYLFGSVTTPPINAGTYKVTAILDSGNYSAAPAVADFKINKTNNYTITPINGGNLAIGATSAATLSINQEAYEILYVGKTYNADGELSSYDNFRSSSFPSIYAGEYVGTVISDNYAPKTFNFNILKTDISSDISLFNYTMLYGVKPTLPQTVTVGSDTYKVKYLFKAAGEAEYSETMPTMVGEHSIKMVVCAANVQGEKFASFTIGHENTAVSKVVMSPYFMYTGLNIVPEAHLYLNSILQTNPQRAYYKDGEVVSYVREVGNYKIELYVNAAHRYTADFSIVPKINLTNIPAPGTSFSGAEYHIGYEFESASDRPAHDSYIEVALYKDDKIVPNAIAKNAGNYTATITYNQYVIYSTTFTINKKALVLTTPEDVYASVDDYSAIKKVIDERAVTYEISISGTMEWQHILPPVGSHTIRYTIVEENYSGSVVGNIHVAKQSLELNIDDFSVEYTGADLIMPESLASFEELSYKYSTSASGTQIPGLPRTVGTYYVTVFCSSDTYLIKYKDSTRPYIIVTITKATPDYIVSNLTQTYDGTSKTPVYTALHNGNILSVNISNSEMIDAGEYEIFFSIIGNDNYEVSSTYTFTIEKADVDITYTLPSDLIYDGAIKTDYDADASAAEVGDVSIEIKKDETVVPIKDAGRYTMTLTTAASANYNAATKVVIFNVMPAKTTVECFVRDHNYQYNKQEKYVVVNTFPTETTKDILYNGSPDAPTDAGTYTAVITVTPADPNYSIEVITYKYTIVPVADTITYTGAPDGYFYYDGSPKKLGDPKAASETAVTAVYEQLNTGGTSYTTITNLNTLTEEGNYRVTLTSVGNSNYYATTRIVYFTIYREQLVASISSKIVEYNGSQQKIDLNAPGISSSLLKIQYKGYRYAANGKCTTAYDSDTAPTEAGYYTATLTPTDSKYAISGNTSAKLIIKRKISTITVDIAGVADDAIIIDYTGTTYAVTATATTKDGSVAVNTLDNDALMIRLVGTETNTTLTGGGSYEIIVDLQGTNYTGHYKRLLTIKPQDATIFVKQTAVEFTGAPNNIVYTVLDKNGNDITELVKNDVLVRYSTTENGPAIEAINVGSYYANIILTSSSYVGTATYKFKIVKTRPVVEYRPESGDPLTLSTSRDTQVDVFNVDRYSFKFNGVNVSTSEYVVEILYKDYEDITPDDGEDNEVAVWKKYTVPADRKIIDPNNYKISITLIAKDLYKNNLEYNSATHETPQIKDCDNGAHTSCPGHIVYDFLFTILPS